MEGQGKKRCKECNGPRKGEMGGKRGLENPRDSDGRTKNLLLKIEFGYEKDLARSNVDHDRKE